MASARSSLIESGLKEQHACVERSCLLETIFDHIPDASVLCDRDLHVVGVNRAAERLLGIPAQEMVGRNWQNLLRDVGSMQPVVSESTQLPGGTLELRSNSGRTRTVAIRAVQVCDDANVIQGMVATLHDVTAEIRPAMGQVIAESRAMVDLLGLVRKVAESEATSVLLQGENGTGKDLIAKSLHYQSLRQSKPFLVVNCAAIPESLLESELFGYEKGAFTDARAQKRGLFELADKGTLFLDEIGEMPPSLQAKLLRALEERTFRRLGSLRDIYIDIRILAASNTNLSAAVQAGTFRRDLYYRLNVIQLVVPALRERPEDILPLARFFMEQYNARFKRSMQGISPEAERLMLAYDWPGNVRELRNAIERAMIFEETACIRPASLHLAVPVDDQALMAPAGLGPVLSFSNGKSILFGLERSLLVQALEATTGNQSHAARLLRISRDTLRYKMKKFNLPGPRSSV
jgi:PAS domain S-box-containing protein